MIQMAGLSISLHILILCVSLLTHQIQGSQFHPMNPEMRKGQYVASEAHEDKSYYAVHMVSTDNRYIGMQVIMDVHVHNLTDGQASATAIWISNLDGGNSDLNSIAVGWEISPDRYGDSDTHFYTEWTRDAYRNTGCHNMNCPGFKSVNGSGIEPGAFIQQPVSEVLWPPQKITVRVVKDPSTGDWWIYYTPTKGQELFLPVRAVGFYPANLFNSLDKKATHIAFGGAVTSRTATLPPMGSGAFPSNRTAARLSAISLIEEDGTVIPINKIRGTTTLVITNSRCYSAAPITDVRFSYGGPGGCSAQV